jgi:hypothetical protein
MKRFLEFGLIVSVLALIFGAQALKVHAAPPPQKEAKDISVVEIPDKTRVVKTILQGKYIFVHDDERMAKGEDCFYIYEYSLDASGKPDLNKDKLVVSFHCTPVQRPKATQIVMTYGIVNADLSELREIQFPGSTEGHRVP